MTTHHQEPEESSAQRKQRLLEQCKAYRVAIGEARDVVRENLGADAIAKTAIGLVSVRAQSAFASVSDLFDLKSLTGEKLRRLLPLVVSGVSLLSKRSVLRPILRGALVVGSAGTALYFLSKKKKAKHVALHEHL
ncbi:Hypothetical protein mma_3572 [Janthinobacterium sp. Marseille]|nr:hypothetical protein [Janthinobacterium sp. Marseille]ABR91325.1 Hypothetical protein mma_3572 [Janthinobacterium sp. Marseille]